eukprot:COSAG01_NODE_23_length_37704_cov_30.005877_53_plen_105_part_01
MPCVATLRTAAYSEDNAVYRCGAPYSYMCVDPCCCEPSCHLVMIRRLTSMLAAAAVCLLLGEGAPTPVTYVSTHRPCLLALPPTGRARGRRVAPPPQRRAGARPQ